MQTLLQRLESLTAPSREVSDELLLSWGWTKKACRVAPCEILVSPSGEEFHTYDEQLKPPQRPHPTASIDDALLGVPEGCDYVLQSRNGYAAVIKWNSDIDVGTPLGTAIHPVLTVALCIAIVKARGGV